MDILDPTQDLVFKLLFDGPRSQGILIALLTAILAPKSPIADVTVLNPGISRQNINDKEITLDLLVQLDNGTQVHIEMQSDSRPGFSVRIIFYWARAFVNQLHRGEAYTKLKPVVSIVFTGYRVFRDMPCLHSTFHILEVKRHVRLTNVFELHLVELPKIEQQDSFSEVRPEVARWARFLGAKTDEERRKVSQEDPMVREAYEWLVELSSSEDVQRYAREREENLKLNEIERRLMRAEARAEGRVEGRVEGEETGTKKGKREAIQRILSLRSIELTPSDHDALMACHDITTLDKLLERAVLMQPGQALFEGES